MDLNIKLTGRRDVMKHDKPTNRGQIAVTAFVASAVLIVAVGAAIYFTQKEDSKAVSAGKSSVAMKMAEQALSRAIWKVEERIQNWDTLMAGAQIDGYKNDQKYVEGDGEYCIDIAMANATNLPGDDDRASKVVITATGRDKDKTDLRVLKAVYKNENEKPDWVIYVLNDKTHKRQKRGNLCKQVSKKSAFLNIKSGFYEYANALAESVIPSVQASSSKSSSDDDDNYEFDEDQMRGVHWGPICVLGSWKMKNGHGRYWLPYPRKFATESITGRDTNPSPPNTDGEEWWSYSDEVPSAPTMNYDYYKYIAQHAGADSNGNTVYAGGGEYHTLGDGSSCIPSHSRRKGCNEDKNEDDENDHHWLINRVDTAASPRCYFFDNVNCKITGNTFINGIVIARNATVFIREGKRSHANGQFTVTVPNKAWREYGAIDTAASGEYPGDAGYQHVQTTPYTFDSTNAVTVKGIIWADKKVYLKGGACVYGIIVVGKNFQFDGGGSAQVFYDNTLTIKATDVSLEMDTYNEVRGSWPSALN